MGYFTTDRWRRMTGFDSLCRAVVIVAALIAPGIAAAQFNPDIAVLFSRDAISGTARAAGAGGAFSSVGADLGSMDLNPAGLGLYKSSDICITPGLRIAADQTTYQGTSQSNTTPSFVFAQAGAEWTKQFGGKDQKPGDPGYSSHPLKSITLAFNFQGTSFYNRTQGYSLNSSPSLVKNYAGVDNQFGTDQWSAESANFGAAGLTYADSLGYHSNVHSPTSQQGTITTTGGVNKILLGFGADILDKLYFGFDIGIPILNYTTNTDITETALNADSVSHFTGYQMSSYTNESGVGVTGSLGLIYKPVSWMRLGASYALPTWYFLTENYNSTLIAAFDTPAGIGTQNGYQIDADPVSYKLRTPMKGTMGASFYLEDHALLSVDYSFQNMGAAHYTASDTGSTAALNSYMKGTYTFQHTVRAGIEGAYKILRLRAGYSYSTSPFRSGQNYAPSAYNESTQNITAGIGLRFKRFYVDFAYVFSYMKDALSPNFQIPFDQSGSSTNPNTDYSMVSRYTSSSLFLTIGFKISSDASSSPSKQRRTPNGDNLPRYIDPGDKY